MIDIAMSRTVVRCCGQFMVTGRCGHHGETALSAVAPVKGDAFARVQTLDLGSAVETVSEQDKRHSSVAHTAVQVMNVVLRPPRPPPVWVNHGQPTETTCQLIACRHVDRGVARCV